MSQCQEKVWWVEHQIRSLTKLRGMRCGKAIRRVLNTTDEETQALAGLWGDGEFSVVFGDTSELFSAAYTQIRSCMQGRGELCHRAYTPHGVGIAVSYRDGEITARGLHHAGMYNKTYGQGSYALSVFFEKIAGIKFSTKWIDDETAEKCLVTETYQYQEKVVITGRTLIRAVKASEYKPEIAKHLEKETNVEYPGYVFLYKPEKVGFVVRTATRIVFKPYIDR